MADATSETRLDENANASTSGSSSRDAAITIDADDETPHEMRITTHGRIRNWSKFALDFLNKYPRRPLVLHTLPAHPTSFEKLPVETSSEGGPSRSSKRKKTLTNATTMIPKLISVVEIIKREFLIQETIRASKPSTEEQPDADRQPSILYQYNEVGVLEDANPEQTEQLPLEDLLSGRHHLKIKRTPYMKVYLCRTPLSAEVIGDATPQDPLAPPKKSKAAKTRERRRKRKLREMEDDGSGQEDEIAAEVSDAPVAGEADEHIADVEMSRAD